MSEKENEEKMSELGRKWHKLKMAQRHLMQWATMKKIYSKKLINRETESN